VNYKQESFLLATLVTVGACVAIYLNQHENALIYDKDMLGFAFLAAMVGVAGFVWFGREVK